MKNLIFACVFLINAICLAQTADGDDEYWEFADTWDTGTVPGTYTKLNGYDDLQLTTEDVIIDADDMIRVGWQGNLVNTTMNQSNYNGSLTVTSGDTLVFYGNLTLNNKSMDFNIDAGGVVIVLGNMTIKLRGNWTVNGLLAVNGTLAKDGTSSGSNVNWSLGAGGAVYSNDYDATFEDMNSGVDPELDVDSDLATDHPDIFAFMESGGEPLPVELVSFGSEVSSEGVELNWNTASELNNDFFSVQRSENGKDFYEIGIVNGNGTTDVPQTYNFSDHSPVASIEYYRLNQVDFDGASEIHKTIVAFTDKLSRQISLEVYPNPASEKISLRSVRPLEYKELVLMDMAGRVVADLRTSLEGGGLKVSTGLPTLKKGLYHVKYVTTDGSSGIKKLIIE